MSREVFTADKGKSYPTLSTGEKFYTNFTAAGAQLGDKFVTVDEYVASLRGQFSSVVVKPIAVDVTGRKIEGDVAIFVKE